MVRSRHKQVRDADVTLSDLSWRSRELRDKDWTNKRPSTLDRYRYVRPGCNPDGVEGVNVFLGEKAVLEYYANILRTRARTSSLPSRGDAELTRAVQIVRKSYGHLFENTSCRNEAESVPQPPQPSQMLSPPRSAPPNVLSSAPTTPPSSPGAGRRSSRSTRRSLADTESPMAATPPPNTTLIATSPHVSVGSPGNLDDDSELEAVDTVDDVSVESAEDGSDCQPGTFSIMLHIVLHLVLHFADLCMVRCFIDGSVGDGVDDEDEDGGVSSELLVDKDDSLNMVCDGDDSAEYAAMDSGDAAAKDDLVMDEDSGEDDECADTHIPADKDEYETSETEIAAEVLFAEQFLDCFGGEDAVLAGNFKNDFLREMAATGWEDVEEPDTFDYMNTPYEPVDNTRSYPGLRQGYSGPTADALRNADSPLALFFFFLPVVLWQHIAVCSNEYVREMAPLRVDERYKCYRSKFRLNPHLPKKTKRDIQTELEGMKPIQPHELCRFIGLLIARTIAPNREKLANHWKTTDEGGIPRGAFGSVLRRDRFMEIPRTYISIRTLIRGRSQIEHGRFAKLWKFYKRHLSEAHLAFDEAMLPSRSSFNKMRIYMKDKPHKWGTKFFMLCSAVTAYCIRFEVYCGKKQHSSDAHKTDMKSGPAAVVRNLLAVFGPDSQMNGMRLVVVDRFYTSVALAIQLLLMGFYCVGTIMTNSLGYCKGVIEKMKSRPATIARGSFKVLRSKLVPNMTAVSWWDARPVHFLCTGGSLEVDRVARQEFADKVEVPCPRVVKDYHAFMGRVDVHDQLRLQRYSIQRAVRFKKYYKWLVLGLIDLVIVNGYIVHKAYHKQKSSRPLTHVKYMKKLHL
ncbi:LOW QUALITY PROTEIN: Hypothetical protein PHPALM_13792 [Phytophthora palmivora]|uniref:PiggyBac transposable element-derived protein domain-containing protein n=1 Tax=Phytophthora palmivora TaxID=4796 RepID=A0A2P4XWG0_9STRA|nr:LOW QUALITY PROTEIN: Hypothetical protein PHPALM_13792 [Phytophthora palmivora]